MKVPIFIVSLLILISCACDSTQPLGEKLWYDSPADNWFEALPLGNGRLGAMVFGTIEEDRLQLNEESLWAGCPEDPYPENLQEHYAEFRSLNLEGKYNEALEYAYKHLAVSPTSFRSYTTLGDLFIKFNQSNATEYKRSLDLETGISTVEYEINGKKYLRESFVSAKYDALIYHFSSPDKGTVNCDIRYEREKDVILHQEDDHVLYAEGQLFDDPDGYDDNKGGSGKGGYHMKFSTHMAVQGEKGEFSSGNGIISLKDAGEFTLIFTAATDYNPEIMNFDRRIDSRKVSRQILSDAMEIPYETIRKDHISDHSEVYNRLSFQISDLMVDTIPTDRRISNLSETEHDNYLTQVFFQYGRYLLMASSGGNARLPANLQGIWNDRIWARWEADYHLNINLQMNYWPADVCNLPETLVPLSDFMVRLSEKGKITAEKFIGSEGWLVHTVSNPFGRTTPGGSNQSSQINNGYCFPLAGAWMSMTLWRHYEFSRDEEYLRETVYPVIKGASQFILDFLLENEKGELVTAPSYSPENAYIDPGSGEALRNTMAATIDIEIIRHVFQACMDAEEILGVDGLTNEIQSTLAKLPDLKIGADGTLQEWYEDYEEAEPGHRHISHLYALHPANQIDENSPELFTAARKTLEKRLAEGGGQTGWSRAWVINFSARLFDAEECNKHISALIRDQVSPNLLDLHPPYTFQIDGNLGGTAGIAEMLLQSHEKNIIRLLPAFPVDWGAGHATGLKARGDYTVDLYWIEGELENAVITANRGGQPKIIYKGRTVELDMKPGQKISLKASDF